MSRLTTMPKQPIKFIDPDGRSISDPKEIQNLLNQAKMWAAMSNEDEDDPPTKDEVTLNEKGADNGKDDPYQYIGSQERA